MTTLDFINWINGYFALSDDVTINPQQIKVINNHANLVQAVEKHLDNRIAQLLSFIENNAHDGISFVRVKEKWNMLL